MKAIEVLQQFWGHKSFRPLQAEIVESVLSGKDTLALLPTGGGKSVCFQVPGILLGGVTLVISPLIALMRDQVDNLNQRHIPAAMLNSSQSVQEHNQILGQALSGKIRFLYCSPERLRSEAFYQWLKKLPVSLLAIDEAHCISQWGYDFRPAYLEIAAVREMLPSVPCIALTASATPEVISDISIKTRLKQPQIFKGSFHRSNLRYFVLNENAREEKMLEVIRKIGGSGIVYARSRKGTVMLAEVLSRAGISAQAYHAGLNPATRNQIQQDWIEGKVQAIAATNAFGMGIDKPDVRWVVHLSPPPDMESYYQEAGRGGRDGKTAFAVLITNSGVHEKLLTQSITALPGWEEVQKVCGFIWGQMRITANRALYFNALEAGRACGVSVLMVKKILSLLEREDYIKIQEADPEHGQIRFKVNPEDFRYAMDHRKDGDVFEMLLRELGGAAFRDYLDADLRKWAQKRNLALPVLIESLNAVHRSGFIDFSWSGELPIVFVQRDIPPHAPEEMHWKAHLNLQAKAAERMRFMVEYAQETKVCRTQLICQYFGESDLKPCGVCDICSGRHSNEVNPEMLTKLSKELKGLIPPEGVGMGLLKDKIRSIHPGVRVRALRMLAEWGKIRIEGEQVFRVGE